MANRLKEVSYRIRKMREAKDFNQQQIAAKLKITPSAYAKIERGETDPSVTRLYELAEIMEVDVVLFLKNADELPGIGSSVTRSEMDMIYKQLATLNAEVEKLKPSKPASKR